MSDSHVEYYDALYHTRTFYETVPHVLRRSIATGYTVEAALLVSATMKAQKTQHGAYQIHFLKHILSSKAVKLAIDLPK